MIDFTVKQNQLKQIYWIIELTFNKIESIQTSFLIFYI